MISNKRIKHDYLLLNFQQAAYFMISNKHNIFDTEFLQTLTLKTHLKNDFERIELDTFIRFNEVCLYCFHIPKITFLIYQ